MKVNFIKEPVPPKEIIIALSADEASQLRAILLAGVIWDSQYPFPHALYTALSEGGVLDTYYVSSRILERRK